MESHVCYSGLRFEGTASSSATLEAEDIEDWVQEHGPLPSRPLGTLLGVYNFQ